MKNSGYLLVDISFDLVFTSLIFFLFVTILVSFTKSQIYSQRAIKYIDTKIIFKKIEKMYKEAENKELKNQVLYIDDILIFYEDNILYSKKKDKRKNKLISLDNYYVFIDEKQNISFEYVIYSQKYMYKLGGE